MRMRQFFLIQSMSLVISVVHDVSRSSQSDSPHKDFFRSKEKFKSQIENSAIKKNHSFTSLKCIIVYLYQQLINPINSSRGKIITI